MRNAVKKPKRVSLNEPAQSAAKVKNRVKKDQETEIPTVKNEYTQSAVNLRVRDWDLLKDVARARSRTKGGRSSVSGVIAGLIDQSRDALKQESKYLVEEDSE